jgi:hypothetical protein
MVRGQARGMTSHKTQRDARITLGWLGLFAVALSLTIACGPSGDDDEDDGSSRDNLTACQQACQRLDTCGLCLSSEGSCATLTECADRCEAGAFDETCVNGTTSCQEDDLQACLASGGGGAGGSGSNAGGAGGGPPGPGGSDNSGGMGPGAGGSGSGAGGQGGGPRPPGG